MKKLILAVIAVCLMAGVAQADISLTTPAYLQEQAVILKFENINWSIKDTTIDVTMVYYSATGPELLRINCHLDGADYNNVVNNDVECPADNTKDKADLFRRKVQNRCKNIMNIVGTEN